MLSKFAKGGKGFTLIELMIVIAIIAILAAVAIPNFMSARDRARRASAIQALSGMKKAMEMYLIESDRYSSVMGDLMPYTNVTDLGSAYVNPILQVSGSSRYTIIATAKDRLSSVCTVTVDDIVCAR